MLSILPSDVLSLVIRKLGHNLMAYHSITNMKMINKQMSRKLKRQDVWKLLMDKQLGHTPEQSYRLSFYKPICTYDNVLTFAKKIKDVVDDKIVSKCVNTLLDILRAKLYSVKSVFYVSPYRIGVYSGINLEELCDSLGIERYFTLHKPGTLHRRLFEMFFGGTIVYTIHLNSAFNDYDLYNNQMCDYVVSNNRGTYNIEFYLCKPGFLGPVYTSYRVIND